jgi:inosine-uridine nucleoside N-ribohydrolase
METTSREAEFRSKIPFECGKEEYKLYERLIPALANPQNVLVITDIEQDRDDLLAVLILVHMHYLGIINLVGFNANHGPAEKRSKVLRTMLRLTGLPDVSVAAGTDGTGGKEKRDLKWHELQNRTFEHQDWNKDNKERLSGYSLLDNAFKKVNGQELTVLCLSSLQAISEYLGKQDDKFIPNHLAKLVSQGGYEFHDGSIMPDMKAMNNKFHPEAAKSVTDRLNKLAIPSDAWGKEVALAAPLARTFLEDLPGPVGHHLRCASSRQDFVFGWEARHKPFLPHLDEKWLFRGLGIDPNSAKSKQMMEQRIPIRKLMQFGTFPAYDACAAMRALGDHVLQCVGILSTRSGAPDSQPHRMFVPGHRGWLKSRKPI